MSIEKVSYSLIVQEQRPFTTLYSEVIQNLPDMCVLGVYTYLSSLPPNWCVNIKQLMNHFKVGRDKIRSVMNLLKENHLIENTQSRNEDGTMGQSFIVVKDGREFINNLANIPKKVKKETAYGETVDGKSVDGKSTPTYINNNTNNIKNKNKTNTQPEKQVAVVSEPIVLPDWLPNETWEEFKQHRKQLKKPMSELAQKKSIKQLEKMRGEGQDVVEVIEASIANGWQGLFEIKSQGVTHGKGNSNFGTGRKEKFDSTQWLIDRIKSRESGEDHSHVESNLPVQNCEHLWNT